MSRTADFTRQSARNPASSTHGGSTGYAAGDPFAASEPYRADESGFEERTDWQRVGIFGAGLALGIAVGAGTALLLAPQSGESTRELIGEQARAVGDRVADRWDDLRDEIWAAARLGKRRMRRGVTRSRWAAEDALERGRRRGRR